MTRRIAPAVVLFFLSPLIAEYLLGDLSIEQWKFFPFLAPIYGGGSVIIREFARRTGRGWPTMLVLALAYGLIEEGIGTESLFNPNYRGLHLLAYGFIPALGIAGPWTVIVLAVHVFWSIAVPIALAEGLFAPAHEPWLGPIGVGVCGVLYVIGVGLTRLGTAKTESFKASGAERIAVLVVALAVAAAAFRWGPGSGARTNHRAPRPWVVAFVTLCMGSLLQVGSSGAGGHVSAALDVFVLCGLIALYLAWLGVQSRAANWTPAHAAAAGVGGALVYAWWGFHLATVLFGPRAWTAQILPVAIVLGVIGLLVARMRAPVSAS